MRFPILAAAVFSLFLAQGDESLRIDSPSVNGTVSGPVEIWGTAAVSGMTSYSVDFAYGQNPTNTWFPIADGTTPVQHGVLAEWDTTRISEGTYSLRLTAFLQDGSVRDVLVAGIRVRKTAAPAPSSGETVIPFQPDAQTSGRAAVFPAPTAAFASGPSPSGAMWPYREIAFLSGAGLALLAFGTFWVRSRVLDAKHRRFVLQIQKNESDMDDVYLIVGLGNPGREYADTRHNIGFRIADQLVRALDVRFSRQQNHAFVAAGARNGKKVILAKPQTFMNLSGQSIAGLVRFYKVAFPRLFVMCDDIDLPFGALRIRASGGSAGQRGMQSILDALATREIPRLRFGVGRPPGRMDAADYVLHAFETAEEEALPILIEKAVQAALTFVDLSLEEAMNRYNTSPAGSASQPPADEGKGEGV